MATPESCGARCDICPLARERLGGPVQPEHKATTVVVVGDLPSKADIAARRPFSKAVAGILEEGLVANGLTRGDVALVNTIACGLPNGKGKGKKIDLRTYRQNCEQRGLPDPVECCAPYLQSQLEPYDYIIAMSDTAAKAIIPNAKGILSIAGTPYTLPDGRKAVPLLHPAFVMKQPRWRPDFVTGIAKALRWFNNELRWDPYEYVVWPTYDKVVDWFARAFAEVGKDGLIAYDLETDSKYPLKAKIRCIGFSTPTSAMTIPFLSVDGNFIFYDAVTERRIWAFIKSRVDAGKVVWGGHNEGWYDRIVMENRHGWRFLPHFDQIMAHKIAYPLMPHSLDYVGRQCTDVTAWKSDDAGHKISKLDIKDLAKDYARAHRHLSQAEFGALLERAQCVELKGAAPIKPVTPTVQQAWDVAVQIAKRDATLLKYNSMDNVVVSRSTPVLIEKMHERMAFEPCPKLTHLTLLDYADHCQDYCVNLHRQGVYIDQERRARGEQWLRAWSKDLLAEVQSLVHPYWDYKVKDEDNIKDFNPNSVRHKTHLLYKLWDLQPKSLTDGGEPSTADKNLRAHILDDGLDEGRLQVLYALRKFIRVNAKWLGTYVAPFARNPMKHVPTKRNPDRLKPMASRLYPDGRVRAQWNAHGTIPWRYSASEPGMQTLPKEIKPMYTAPPGRILAGADADQIHLRIIACLWNVAYYLECFEMGGDPHATGAYAIFGELFKQVPGFPGGKWVGPVFIPDGKGKWTGKAYDLRQLAKTFIYAFAYGADVTTIWQVLIKAENAHGRLLFADAANRLTESKVAAMRDQTLKRMPEFEAGWALEIAMAEQNGMLTGEAPWLADPVAGFRRDFYGGTNDRAEQNEIRNFRVLATEAAIMHWREMELAKVMPFEFDGPGTGPIIQVHDSISVELSGSRFGGDLDKAGKWAANTVAEALTCRVPGWPVRFTASGTYGQSLLEA